MDSTDSRPSREPTLEVLSKMPSLIVPPKSSADALQTPVDFTPNSVSVLASIIAEQAQDFKTESFSQMLTGPLSPPSPTPFPMKEEPLCTRADYDTPSSLPSLVSSTTTFLTAASSPSPSSSSPLPSPPLMPLAGEEKPPSSPPNASCLPSSPALIKVATGGLGRSNIARFKTKMPSKIPIPRSPYLTIPPGLSPTTLLDSPVLLSTSQAEPSPTTGTFPLPPITGPASSATANVKVMDDDDSNSSFTFKPVTKANRGPPSSLSKMVSTQRGVQLRPQLVSSLAANNELNISHLLPQSASVSFWEEQKVRKAPVVVEPTSVDAESEASQKEDLAIQPAALMVQPLVIERPSEDGYNWRKYGQKQVKGSEFPRSYYKCTHPNCPVKKKVERSHDGQVTEIVYRGEHGHPKPQSVRRSAMANTHALSVSMGAQRNDALQRLHFPSGTSQTSEPSVGSLSDVDGDGEGSKIDDGDDDEPDFKRRRECIIDGKLRIPLRTIGEPRVVVQTTSDIDILDDGYRWRKYGQKVVKGNPHPRSYYKCTNQGCSVRKHVERSSADPKAVITTYEGKHNHDVPASKSNNQESVGSQNISTATMPNAIPKAVQDHYFVGKMLEGRLKVDERPTYSFANVPGASMFSVPLPRSQGITDPLVPASVSFIGTSINGAASFSGVDSSGQSIILRAKEEQDEGNVSSWPSN